MAEGGRRVEKHHLLGFVIFIAILDLIVVALAGYEIDKSFDGSLSGGNGITFTFALVALIAGLLTLAAIISGVSHFHHYSSGSVGSASTTALIAWVITLLAFGFACKEIDAGHTGSREKALEDIDCFYAQSEELRCPSLRGRPVGVTQKFLVVTSNYVARSFGVPKMVSIAEAKAKLPTLVLINGEDLTPYRAESKHIMAVLRRFGTLERHGLDEGAVDITAQVEARLQSGPPIFSFAGHVLGLESPGMTRNGPQSGTLFNFEWMQLNLETLSVVDVSLLVGSQVVAEMRKALEKETGFRCSCGVAQNKMLAKLSSSLNKPSMQTCLLQGAVAEFLAPMAVRKIPGVGHQMQKVLAGMNVETIADLGKVTLKQLTERLGDRIALMLFNAARGQDLSPVQDRGPPKSISVEDSFRNCQTMQQASEILRVLAPDLIRRLDEDREETGRRPRSFTLKWRVQGTKWNFISVSTQMPLELLSPSMTVEKRAFLAVDVAAKLLSRSIQEPFHLVVLNIGATNFESASSSPGVSDIRLFLQGKGKSPDKELKVISKRDARANRESFKTMANNAPLAGGAPTLSTVQAVNLGMERGPLQNLQPWNVPSDVQFEDDYRLSNSSEDEEVDDLADQLKITTRQSSFKRRDDRTMQIQGRAAEFLQQKVHLEQETEFSNKTQPSVSGSPVSSGKVDETTFHKDAKGADSAIVNIPTEQRPLPFKVVNQVQMSSLQKQHHDVDSAVPLSRKSLEAQYLSGVPAEQSCIFANISTKDSKNLMNTNLGNNLRSIYRIEGRLKPLKEPVEVFTKEVSSLSHHPGSSREGPGSERGNICEQCGDLVEGTESGKQEHADYHFALSLEKLDRNPLQRSPELTRVPSTAKPDWVVHSPPPLKKSKSRNGTLDGFVVRRP